MTFVAQIVYAYAAGTVIIADTFKAGVGILIAVFTGTSRCSCFADAFIAALPSVAPQAVSAVAINLTFNSFLVDAQAIYATVSVNITCLAAVTRLITKLIGTGQGPRYTSS